MDVVDTGVWGVDGLTKLTGGLERDHGIWFALNGIWPVLNDLNEAICLRGGDGVALFCMECLRCDCM